MRILIVEDEENLADIIATRLKKENYIVDICLDGEEGLYYALNDIYDLIILDVMLPHKNGFEILKEVREKEISAKIVMLTAKSMIEDKLEGLQNGANDYLTKPFHIEELIARVHIQLNTPTLQNKDVLEYKDLQLNKKTSQLTCTTNNESVELVRKEYQILEYLMTNPNQILSKDQIYDKVWGIDRTNESNNLEAYLSFIRRKLKAISSSITIKSSRGLGYKLEEHND